MMATELTRTIQSRCFLQALIRPENFERYRIQNFGRLLPIVRDSAVSIRGWEFPLVVGHADVRQQGEDWVGEQIDSHDHLELWRLHQSGQFVSLRGLWSDWQGRSPTSPPGSGPSNVLPLWDTIRRFVEIYEFAARLALTEAGDARMQVEVKMGNLQGRVLWQEDPMKTPLRERKIYADTFTFPGADSQPISRDTLVASALDISATALVELFSRFEFDVGTERVHAWQEEVLTR